MPQAISDQDFQSTVLSSSKPTLVDFWAEWCGPCKMVSPILDELEAEMADQIDIYKLNIDENHETPVSYGIRSIPTMLLIKDGEVKGTKVGVSSKGDLKSWIESQI